VTTLAQAEEENERLNDSVFRLLESVDELSQRNLTISVPVNADVTGPVSDAINKMTEEFARVLAQVAKIATYVGTASNAVCTVGGVSRRRSTARVISPSVPSEPTNICGRS